MNIINSYRFAAGGYLLDDYTGASAGYSLRALSSSYETTNPVVQVRRSDNTLEAFTASEVAAGDIEAFCGAGDGFVRIMFNQTGGSNAIQTTNTQQPKICSSGTLLTDGLLFDGTDDFLNSQFNHGTASAQSIFVVAQTSDLTANRMLIDGRDANDDGIGMFYITASDYLRFHVDTTDVFSNTSLSANTEYLFAGIYGSTTSTFYENGTQTDTDGTAPSSSSSTTSYKIGRNGYSSTAFWQGSIQEVIIYPTDESSNRTGIEGNINDHYAIY